jgi:radical SAM protein with 4Fe4S-binding SPASM domain
MSTEEFLIILDKLKEHTRFIYYHLMGEPLVHPLLPDFIRLAGAQGYKSVITTNGTLLYDRKDELLAAGIHKVNISVHSFEDGSDEDFMRYICQIADFAKSAAETGVIITFRFWNKGCDNGRNDFSLRILKEQIPGDWITNTRGIRIRDKIFIESADRFQWPDSNAEIQGSKFFCYGLKAQFGILADGTVVPCCLDSEGTINLGNIFQEDINTILQSERALAMLDGFDRCKASEDLCQRCGFAQRFVR